MGLIDEIHVRWMGSMEVPSPKRGRPGYRNVDGYSVWVDGNQSQPWMQKRAAIAEAKELGKKLGRKVIVDPSDWRHSEARQRYETVRDEAAAKYGEPGMLTSRWDSYPEPVKAELRSLAREMKPSLPPGTFKG
jgi:hypothetical protein